MLICIATDSAGTENVPGVAAFGAILSEVPCASSGMMQPTLGAVAWLTPEERVECRQQLVTALVGAFPTLLWNTPENPTLSVPTTLSFYVQGVTSTIVMDAFDAAQVFILFHSFSFVLCQYAWINRWEIRIYVYQRIE